MSDKTDLKSEIYEDLKGEGLSYEGIVTKTSGGTYDPITNTTSSGTSTAYTLYLIFDVAGNIERHREIYPEINASDKLAWISPELDYVPKKGDQVVVAELGKTLQIVFNIESSAGVNGLFKTWLR